MVGCALRHSRNYSSDGIIRLLREVEPRSSRPCLSGDRFDRDRIEMEVEATHVVLDNDDRSRSSSYSVSSLYPVDD